MKNIFIEKKCYSIKKIKRVANGWYLYQKAKDSQPVFISNKNYGGKMPIFFKTIELEVVTVDGFQISAVLNGVKLFEIEESEYPQQVRELIKKGEVLAQEYAKATEERSAQVCEALKEYLLTIPINPSLEQDISKFKVCLRVFLKMHLLKGGKEYLPHLNLMAILCEMAQRIYYRRVDEDKLFDTLFAGLKTGTFCGVTWPRYEVDVKLYEQACKDDSEQKTLLEFYYEVDSLMELVLPPIENELLKRYLNYTVREIVRFFADDNAEFRSNFAYTTWGRRTFSDEEEYGKQYKNMKFLKYKSLLLPEVFADKQIDDFVKNYNLR